ncbi:MAG: hypothetical protein E6X49_14830 [Leclercia adecarboxylata]|nr:hypothetical protein [Leclercia adecarboxylata]
MSTVIAGAFEIADPEGIVVFTAFTPVDEILQVGDIAGGEREGSVAANIVFAATDVIIIVVRRGLLARQDNGFGSFVHFNFG